MITIFIYTIYIFAMIQIIPCLEAMVLSWYRDNSTMKLFFFFLFKRCGSRELFVLGGEWEKRKMFGYISDENLTNSPGDTLRSKKKKKSLWCKASDSLININFNMQQWRSI